MGLWQACMGVLIGWSGAARETLRAEGKVTKRRTAKDARQKGHPNQMCSLLKDMFEQICVKRLYGLNWECV